MIRPHIGPRLTQGTIFSCARAEEYEGCPVSGLVITARCDVEHDKAPVLNYVPVVRFDDWLHRDFFDLLFERCHSDVHQQFLNVLKNCKVAPSVLIAHQPREVIEKFLPTDSEDRAIKKARAAATECIERLERVDRLRGRPVAEHPILALAADFAKLRDRLISECVRQQVTGFYFLPSTEPGGDALGFVALLREVRHLPRALAHKIAVGLDGREYKAMCAERPSLAGLLSLPENGFGYAVGLLESPDIEHLMQTFSMLFARIGLPDPSPSYVARLWSEQPSVKGEGK